VCAVGVQLEFQPGAPVALSRRFSEAGLGYSFSDRAEVWVELSSMALAAGAGVDDLGFVERLRVSAEAADGSLPSVELVADGRPGAADPWLLEGAAGVNLVPYLEAAALVFEVELVGDLPRRQWSLVVDACFSLAASYRVGPGDL
jgi:hypothetical protein